MTKRAKLYLHSEITALNLKHLYSSVYIFPSILYINIHGREMEYCFIQRQKNAHHKDNSKCTSRNNSIYHYHGDSLDIVIYVSNDIYNNNNNHTDNTMISSRRREV